MKDREWKDNGSQTSMYTAAIDIQNVIIDSHENWI